MRVPEVGPQKEGQSSSPEEGWTISQPCVFVTVITTKTELWSHLSKH